MKATIEKIHIKLGDKAFEFTLEEAKALKDLLNEKLEPKVQFPQWPTERDVEKHIPWFPNQPGPWPPSVPSRPAWFGPEIICLSENQLAQHG